MEEERKDLSADSGSDDLFKTPPEGNSEDDEPKKSGSDGQEKEVAKPAMLSQET